MIRSSSIALCAATLLPAGSLLAATSFNIDFRNDTWEQGGTTGTGWRTNTATGRPYTTGTTDFGDPALSLTVTSAFVGTATRGQQNLTFDPPNTAGFAFQNNGSADFNRGTSLDNYQRIDFAFSSPVLLDTLQLEDIDTQNTTGPAGWRDATTIQLWNSSPPPTFGLGISPDITLNPTTNLSVIDEKASPFGVSYVYATTRGNTINNDPRSTANFSSSEAVDGFSIYLWNQRDGNSGGNHGIALRASGNTLTVVPEPSVTGLLGLMGTLFLLRRRRD